MKRFTGMLLVLLGISGGAINGAVIYVTTVQDKISSTGGCSLKEAIYSANWHVNKAYSSTLGGIIPTNCVPGTGNDTIYLPFGATLPMISIARDAYNFTGATATPLIFSNITIEANGALLQGLLNARAFAVGSASVPKSGPPFPVSAALP